MNSRDSQLSQVLDVPEIGSSLQLADDLYLTETTSRRLPWEDAADIMYVESGRQALTVVESELRNQGQTHFFVPSYLCDSMIDPFHRTGWTLTGLPVDENLGVRPEDLLSSVREGVLLHAPYFGRQDSPAMLDALQTLRQRGVVVVVDETHRVLSSPSQVADIRVASLRKTLPVYDGAYVSGLTGLLHQSLENPPSESEIVVLHEMAMRAKSIALANGSDTDAHRALFEKAEHATDLGTRPAQMSAKSLGLLHCLDLDLIRTSRQTNSNVLAEALGHSDHFRVINPPAEDLVPFYLILDTSQVAGLQRYMARQRIYCPIHWIPSEILSRIGTWPNHYISLPIDQRYGESDMRRIAANVKAFFATS